MTTTISNVQGPERPLYLSIGQLYATVLAFFVIGINFLGLPAYMKYTYLPGVEAADWKLAMAIATLPLFLLMTHQVRSFVTSPFVIWVAIYAAWNFGYMQIHPNEITDGIYTGELQTLIAVTISAFCLQITRSPTLRRFLLITGIVFFVLLVLDFLFPGQFYEQPTAGPSYVPGRASATQVNPNEAAMAMALMALFVLSSEKMRFKWAFMLMATVGILITLSRAGIAVAGIYFLAMILFGGGRGKILGALVAICLALVVSNPTALVDYMAVNFDVEEGISVTRARVEGLSNSEFEDSSSDERAEVAAAALDVYYENMASGLGPGATIAWPTGTHNLPMRMGAELGTPGFLFWIALVLMIWQGRRFAANRTNYVALASFIIFSFASHNILENQYWLLALFLLSSRSVRTVKRRRRRRAARRRANPVPEKSRDELVNSIS